MPVGRSHRRLLSDFRLLTKSKAATIRRSDQQVVPSTDVRGHTERGMRIGRDYREARSTAQVSGGR